MACCVSCVMIGAMVCDLSKEVSALFILDKDDDVNHLPFIVDFHSNVCDIFIQFLEFFHCLVVVHISDVEPFNVENNSPFFKLCGLMFPLSLGRAIDFRLQFFVLT